MTTVIVPVDFSETSLNAARYAASMLTGHDGVTIILYHSYSKASEESETMDRLELLQAELVKSNPVNIELLSCHDADFIAGLEKTARHKKANLVIMGITGKSSIGQVFFGSNTLKMAQTKACPVLVVPQHAKFTKMDNVMLASDFKDTYNTTPSVPIKEFLSIHKPKLHVVNVDKDHYVSLTEKYEAEKQNMRKLLDEYDPEFYFMRIYDVDEALDMFAADRDIDVIIAIQKQHSFMQKLIHNNRTKRLSYHSKTPILIIHE
ncbi:MAG: universal stress protein [Ferruginibacter sp.]